jgi:hypothetical protein
LAAAECFCEVLAIFNFYYIMGEAEVRLNLLGKDRRKRVGDQVGGGNVKEVRG